MNNESPEVVEVERKQPTLDSVVNWQLPFLAILFVSVVFVAIKSVVHRHESRVAYMKLQKLEKQRDKLAAQWSRLKLEQATTLNQVRVEQYARWDLDMKMPKTSEIRIIQEPLNIKSVNNVELAAARDVTDAASAALRASESQLTSRVAGY